MKEMSISEASEFFKVSKEAIHNRIRRGSLKSIVKDGVKLVIVDDVLPKKTIQKNDTKYQDFLEKHIVSLEKKIEKLENETRKLREQKEELLVQERQKIEQIYKEKDEQLKNILSVISAKFLPQEISKESEHVEVEIEPKADEIVSLKKYLKTLKLSDKKKDKIKKRFKKAAKKDKRIEIVDGKCYLNLTKYKYDDLVG